MKTENSMKHLRTGQFILYFPDNKRIRHSTQLLLGLWRAGKQTLNQSLLSLSRYFRNQGVPGQAMVIVLVLASVTPAFSQKEIAAASRVEDKKKGNTPFLQANSVGDVLWTSSPNPGPFHLDGVLSLWTSDYFRARYGGVPADLDYLSYRLSLGVTYELLRNNTDQASLKALAVSVGINNYFTDSPVPDEDSWYTSDRYVGLAAAFSNAFHAGLTYTAYKNPYSQPGTLQDIALLLLYAPNNRLGSIQPQIKLVKAVGQSTGSLIQTQITPVFKLVDSLSLTLSVPISLGVGFNGYHGSGAAEGYYAELGILGSLPLDLKLPGRWILTAGTFVTLRDDSIVSATEKYDDAGHIVPTGLVTLSFAY